ncbi:MAG: glycosyltransferase [Candidatus Dormibacteria bacterium]
MTPGASRFPITLLVPLRRVSGRRDARLAGHLGAMGAIVDQVLVVDGSTATLVEEHRRHFGPPVDLVPAPPRRSGENGKVVGVLEGLRRARHDIVVIADEDVRHTAASLSMLAAALDDAAAVLPDNYFLRPLPWHAYWDTARTLINRATGGDWPGTMAVRRSFILDVGGYRSDVLFENLELVRTVVAAGGRVERLPGCFVGRQAPSLTVFLRQRVRQAYDELARPGRLAASLAVLPLTVVGARRPRALGVAAAAIVLAAEYGRRLHGGRTVYPATASLLAPVWILERGICSWIAVGLRLRGGVNYAGTRIRYAATL